MQSLKIHGNCVHKYPKPPPAQPSTYRYHPHLNARPCDTEGNFLPPNTPPPPRAPADSWHPYEDRASFEMSELLITKIHASNDHINELLRILAAKRASQTDGEETTSGFFENANDMFSTTDSSPYGEAPWITYQLRLKNPERYDAPWATSGKSRSALAQPEGATGHLRALEGTQGAKVAKDREAP
ncbi:hypothetical protein LXA43DRAFT_1097531 [Ganoderma leucocontextum]|nr:hypothetical protein LXA43DRAFT_1097531 [Ganoderma leucocontextum]